VKLQRPWTLAVLAQTLWLPALLLAAWEMSSSNEWINPFFFPRPTKVLATAGGMAADGELARVLGATLSRWAAGAVLGILSGIACGALMGVSTAGRRALEPFISGLYSTPKLTLLPLLMLLMGLGNAPKVTLIALVGFIFLATQTLDAIRSVKPGYVEMARNYGAGRWALLRRVYLPAALPQIFTGLRIAFSRSLVVAISLELVSGSDGLGALIWMSWETLAIERLYVGILFAASLGILMHRGLAALESSLVPWRM
jgi:NitT/TauT family transport system permease protein